jgi:hypothetical protein
VCALERMIQFGVFALKTPHCYSHHEQTKSDIANLSSHDLTQPSKPIADAFKRFDFAAAKRSSSSHGDPLSYSSWLHTTQSENVVESKMMEEHSKRLKDDTKKSPVKPECPVCTYSGLLLAKDMPCASRVGSRLLCRGSGTVMDQNNPPVALPNGQVIMSN